MQIWTAHEEQLVTSLITAGDSYPNPSGNAYIVLDMSGTDEGYPPAVASWFFAGDNQGRDSSTPATPFRASSAIETLRT